MELTKKGSLEKCGYFFLLSSDLANCVVITIQNFQVRIFGIQQEQRWEAFSEMFCSY